MLFTTRPNDGTIDMKDFEMFVNCAIGSGPEIPADPNCDGSEQICKQVQLP